MGFWGFGAGWDSLLVSSDCGASRSLSDLNGNPDALKSIGQKCKGKQPWQGAASQECGETPRVSQKNASNIYQPVIVSAIDIEVAAKEPKINNTLKKIKDHSLYPPLISRFGNSLKSCDKDTSEINARWQLPPHKECGPAPNEMAEPVLRLTSKNSGATKNVRSLLAAPNIKNTRSFFLKSYRNTLQS